MVAIPESPKIYHITPVEKLEAIVEAGCLWSDAKCIELGLVGEAVGIAGIKADRLERRPVKCHPSTTVGQYVPFYLCPRSVMLYILHMGNREGLSYKGGQRSIVHLVADLRRTAEWAEQHAQRWAMTDRNAAIKYASFYCGLEDLDKVHWEAVDARSWREVSEVKQAEFLMHESFPWTLVERIGVHNDAILAQVEGILRQVEHRPPVTVETGWYY
jgi:ssDNA thymidine ADP-ribosyltransferase, DarT